MASVSALKKLLYQIQIRQSQTNDSTFSDEEWQQIEQQLQENQSNDPAFLFLRIEFAIRRGNIQEAENQLSQIHELLYQKQLTEIYGLCGQHPQRRNPHQNFLSAPYFLGDADIKRHSGKPDQSASSGKSKNFPPGHSKRIL